MGFIALAGVAAETGVVMLIYLDHAWGDAGRCGRGRDADRPISTFMPRSWKARSSACAEDDDRRGHHRRPAAHPVGHRHRLRVMSRIAAPMVGGMMAHRLRRGAGRGGAVDVDVRGAARNAGDRSTRSLQRSAYGARNPVVGR